MSRIISGFADNLTLAVPKTGTRPTSDRVREALFSSLDSRDEIRGRRVLDLYAGTGGLGLEAASRGAASVVLVEKAPAAAKVCRKNADAVTARAPQGAAPRIDVVSQPVRSYLLGSSMPVDLVFFDPPYEVSTAELAADLAALVPSLADQALVVVERASRDGEPAWPDGLHLDMKKQYGDTTVWFAVAA
ncbi:16S rRNA (guanine(966)-N(2))-methyltransferase RsmD [Frigoribacterium sp. 2-23]|uniref:16S rRNA (guanine(966)-N(2))-methyltransferase RsmD n=1 Tax=Frigoribacterium sp. 2-23 TaxID=3415006 RepID=UPI003C6F387F